MRTLFFLLPFLLCQRSLALDSSVRQLIVSIAPTWTSSTGRLQLLNARKTNGCPWENPSGSFTEKTA